MSNRPTSTQEVADALGIDLSTDDEIEKTWRGLALQFDAHRIAALSVLRRITELPGPDGRILARQFLAAPPLSGEAVLAGRIRELVFSEGEVENAAARICHATGLNWETLDDPADYNPMEHDAETKGWFRYLARAALSRNVK